MQYTLSNKKIKSVWDETASLLSLSFGGKMLAPCVQKTYYAIGENAIDWDIEKGNGDELRYIAFPIEDKRRALIRSNEELSVIPEGLRLDVGTSDDEITLGIRMQSDGEAIKKDSVDLLGNRKRGDELRLLLSINLPESAVFHLAEYRNIGRRLDGDMAYEHWYDGRLMYNMLLVEVGGMWIRFRTLDEVLSSLGFCVWRHEETFTLSLEWSPSSPLLIACFDSYEDAMGDFRDWLENKKSITKLSERSDVPDWLHEIALVLNIDMLLSNGYTLHDFKDVADIASDMKQYIDPKKVLFYIPGWQGKFDSSHPYYEPSKDLGGAEAFESMLNAVHDMGYRVMVHTTVFGVDPYLPDIDSLEKLIRKDGNGKIIGWQLTNRWIPGKKPFEFNTKKIPLKPHAVLRVFKVPVGYVPGECEAYITVGGIKGSARITIGYGGRSISSPHGWFGDNELCDYIYPLMLDCGHVKLTVEITEKDGLDLDNAWICIRQSYTAKDINSPLTLPILIGDGENSDFVELISGNIKSLVEKYDIDAVHVDAGSFYIPFLNKDIFLAVKDVLGEDILMACEWFNTWEEFGFHTLSQNAVGTLVLNRLPKMCIKEANSYPMLEGIKDYYSWMDKTSPICDFVSDYLYTYPHLCAIHAFVPTRKVCNWLPERKIPYSDNELMEVICDSERLRYIPALRINYRQYGLDQKTIEALQMIDKRK
jgi:hypothetical protein